jgi:hypothetical protein
MMTMKRRKIGHVRATKYDDAFYQKRERERDFRVGKKKHATGKANSPTTPPGIVSERDGLAKGEQ